MRSIVFEHGLLLSFLHCWCQSHQPISTGTHDKQRHNDRHCFDRYGGRHYLHVTEHSPSKPATSTDCHRNQSEAVENGPFRDEHDPHSKYTDESKQTGKLEYADEHITSGFNGLHQSRQRNQASDHESQNQQVTNGELNANNCRSRRRVAVNDDPKTTDDQQWNKHTQCCHDDDNEQFEIRLTKASFQYDFETDGPGCYTDQPLPPGARSERSPDSEQTGLSGHEADKRRYPPGNSRSINV